MSISDLIVVMKDGVVQQIGKPQEVYDDPVNQFVAQFLGTPPINLFDGSVHDGRLFIGGTPILDAACDYEGPVKVGIRPEGLNPRENGALSCGLHRVEVMGRDISVVCGHPAFTGDQFRAIIDSDELAFVGENAVRFDVKRNKVFAFRCDTGERIRF